MTYSEDHIALAAEYALGTLDADERALVETMMIVDHGFMEVVESWERKLAPLHQMVGPVEPPAHVWDNIKMAAGLTGKQMPMSEAIPTFVEPPVEERHVREPQKFEPVIETFREERVEPDIVVEPIASTQPVPPPASQRPIPQPSVPERSNVVELSNRRRGGTAYSFLMTAVAASLAGVIALQAYRPDLLPEQLRIKPKIQTVEIKTPAPPPGAQFVALLQQDASLPAFILTVDTTTKNFTVRKVGAVPEPGKSYELWLVSDKLQKPRSLGVIGGSDFTVRPALAAYDNDTINKATYAVTIEPEGGSPTGVATGPIVYTGKLVESVPALPSASPAR